MTHDISLEAFLASIERRALRMAQMATSSRDDALDVVQEAMYAFVRSYAKKPEQEWRPLFYKVLHSRIADHHRRNSVRRRVLSIFRGPQRDGDGPDVDPIQRAPDGPHTDPARVVAANQSLDALEDGIRALPDRQRQAFLLRAWEGLSVAETAQAMECSEGAVKTHYHRAVGALRTSLDEHMDEAWL